MSINPPPPGSGLPQITGISPSLEVQSITLETRDVQGEDNAEEENYSLVIKSSLQEGIGPRETARWYDREDYASYLRMRVVVSFDKNASRQMDYVQQRVNEYHSGLFRYSDGQSLRPSYPENIDFIRDLKNPAYGSALALEPFGPFDTTLTTQYVKENNNSIYYLKNNDQYENTAYKDVIIQDLPMNELMVTDEDGNIVRRRTAQVIVPSDLEAGDTRYYLEKVPLSPIAFTMGTQDFDYQRIDFSQISIYCFTYFDTNSWAADHNLPHADPEFNIDYGYITAATPLGSKYLFSHEPPTRSRPASIAPQLQQVLESPNLDIFQDVRLDRILRTSSIVTRLYETFHGFLSTSKIGKSFADTIKSSNFYSPLWITKDNGNPETPPPSANLGGLVGGSYGTTQPNSSQEQRYSEDSARYCFSFDKRSFLVENSKFPLLYMSPEIAHELFSGGRYINPGTEPGEVDERSGILDLKMVRRSFSFDTYAADNDLTTIIKGAPIKATSYYPEIEIETPTLNSQIDMPGLRSSDRVEFYEGRDGFSISTQTMGKYQYGAEFIIKDSSVLYIRRVAEHLRELESSMIEMSNIITQSVPLETVSPDLVQFGEGRIRQGEAPLPPRQGIISDGRGLYDAATRTRIVPLNNISYNSSTMHEESSTIIDQYVNILQNFGVTTSVELPQLKTQLMDLANDADPEGLLEVSKSINLLAFIFEDIAGKEIPFDPYGADLKEPVIERRGYCQRKLVLLQSKHYFDECFEFGKKYKVGYNYLLPNDGGSIANGLMRITPESYRSRASQEFFKYFDFYKDSEITPDARLSAPYDSLYGNSTLTYFSPLTIKTNGKDTIEQTLYRSEDSNMLKFDLNRYGELFADIIKIKYNTEYLTKPFYQLYDNSFSQTKNFKLFHSLEDDLNEHYCYIAEDQEMQSTFPLPSISNTIVNPTTKTDTSRPASMQGSPYGRQDLSAINLIVGGNTLLKTLRSATEITYNQGIITTTEDLQTPAILKGEINDLPPKEPSGLPIKLMFSILGEMELNPHEMGDSRNYLEDTFNSLVENARILGINPNNVESIIDNNLNSIPNQLKSMMVIASTKERKSLGSGFDAVRFMLEDRDDLQQTGRNVSAIFSGELWPPFSSVKDPMKTYAKFLAFWMNYKQLGVVEYLSSYGTLSYGDNIEQYWRRVISGEETEDITRPKPALPEWKKFTSGEFDSFSAKNNRLLCRIRSVMPQDIEPANLPKGQTSGGTTGIVLETKEVLELPVYNQYFILGPVENYNSLDIDLDNVGNPTSVNLDVAPTSTPAPSTSSTFGLVGPRY
jgi:hypothetical protein